MKHSPRKGHRMVSLKADVSKAHRRFKVRRRDWGYQACRLAEDELWLNLVGTFGIGTASYYWARLFGTVGRLTLYLLYDCILWQLIYADDTAWAAAGPNKCREIVMSLFFMVLLGTPFSWKKCRGGLEYEWVGYWLDWGRFELGISELRAQWLIG